MAWPLFKHLGVSPTEFRLPRPHSNDWPVARFRKDRYRRRPSGWSGQPRAFMRTAIPSTCPIGRARQTTARVTRNLGTGNTERSDAKPTLRSTVAPESRSLPHYSATPSATQRFTSGRFRFRRRKVLGGFESACVLSALS
jgi:hypothetical protein